MSRSRKRRERGRVGQSMFTAKRLFTEGQFFQGSIRTRLIIRSVRCGLVCQFKSRDRQDHTLARAERSGKRRRSRDEFC